MKKTSLEIPTDIQMRCSHKMSSVDKEFNLSREDTAEMLRDIADSIEKGSISIDGETWKVYHETDEQVPLRIHSDKEGTEIGLKVLRKNRNQA